MRRRSRLAECSAGKPSLSGTACHAGNSSGSPCLCRCAIEPCCGHCVGLRHANTEKLWGTCSIMAKNTPLHSIAHVLSVWSLHLMSWSEFWPGLTLLCDSALDNVAPVVTGHHSIIGSRRPEPPQDCVGRVAKRQVFHACNYSLGQGFVTWRQ